MLRSMFTAISALNLHQAFMDVVADNLSNANTYGYKSNRVNFQDQFAQTMWLGSAPLNNLGGVNPAQIGLGVRLGAISTNFGQGALQSSGRNTDLAIQGSGFFIYNDSAASFYSRDGALAIDAEGYMVNGSTGMRIQGWTATVTGGVPAVNTGLPLGSIQLPLGTSLARATTNVELGGNLNSDLTTMPIGGTYNATVGVYDSLGALQSVTLTFTRTGNNAWSMAATGGNITTVPTITFDPATGQFTGVNGSITVPGTGGAADTVFSFDLANLTQLATDSDVSITSQNGLSAGAFTSFFVTPENGEIYGVYSNGIQQLIGQLGMATFTNPGGLVRTGQSLWQQGVNSGTPAVGTAGAGDRGSIVSGYLEGSNVDLAQEFTNMILAQRGFQASSRVITTSDEMLQELVNIKR